MILLLESAFTISTSFFFFLSFTPPALSIQSVDYGRHFEWRKNQKASSQKSLLTMPPFNDYQRAPHISYEERIGNQTKSNVFLYGRGDGKLRIPFDIPKKHFYLRFLVSLFWFLTLFLFSSNRTAKPLIYSFFYLSWERVEKKKKKLLLSFTFSFVLLAISLGFPFSVQRAVYVEQEKRMKE